MASKSDKLHLTTVLRINIYSTGFFYIHLHPFIFFFFFFFFYIGHKVIIKCSGKGILGVYNPKLNVFVFIFVPGTFNTILKQKKLQIKSSLKPCLTRTYDNYHLYNCEGLANTLFHAYACNFSNLNNTFLAQKTNLTGQNSG